MTHDEVKAVLKEGRQNIINEHEQELTEFNERTGGKNFHTDMYGVEYEMEYRKMLDSGLSVHDFQELVGMSDFFSMQIGDRALDCLKTGKVSMDEVRACFNDGFTFEQKWDALGILKAQVESEHPYPGSLTDLLKPEYSHTELTQFATVISYNYYDDDLPNIINGIKAKAEINASDAYGPEQCNELANIRGGREILIVADPDRSSRWMNYMITNFKFGLTVEQAEKYSDPKFDDRQSDMLCFCVAGEYPMPEDMVERMADLNLSGDQISAIWNAYDDYDGSQKEIVGYTHLIKGDIDMLIESNLPPERIERLTGLLSNVTDHADRRVIYELAGSDLPDREWKNIAEQIELSEDYKKDRNMLNRYEDRLEKLEEKYKDIPERDLTKSQLSGMKELREDIDRKRREIRVLYGNHSDIGQPVIIPSGEKFADKEPKQTSVRSVRKDVIRNQKLLDVKQPNVLKPEEPVQS